MLTGWMDNEDHSMKPHNSAPVMLPQSGLPDVAPEQAAMAVRWMNAQREKI